MLAQNDRRLISVRVRLPFLYEAAVRADDRFRRRMFEASREGLGVDQRNSIEAVDIPIAIVNGVQDPIVRLDCFDTVDFWDLWRVRYGLPGLGHVPLWQQSEIFNPLLERYLCAVSRNWQTSNLNNQG
jgi:pimeloyl-ACP methyl ester carboxylesterase